MDIQDKSVNDDVPMLWSVFVKKLDSVYGIIVLFWLPVLFLSMSMEWSMDISGTGSPTVIMSFYAMKQLLLQNSV